VRHIAHLGSKFLLELLSDNASSSSKLYIVLNMRFEVLKEVKMVFTHEEEGSVLLGNVGFCLQVHRALQTRRPLSEFSVKFLLPKGHILW
jgi:hypothetical protein